MRPTEPIITDDYLFERVQLNEATTNFLKNTPLGRALYQSAMDDYKNAIVELEDIEMVDFTNGSDKLLAAKMQMMVARKFLLWVNRMNSEADSAERELKQRDDADTQYD